MGQLGGEAVDVGTGESGAADPGLDLVDAVGRLDLPIVLLDLEHLTVRAVSRAFSRHFDLPRTSIVGRSILDFVRGDDRQGATVALTALRSGAVDFYRARRSLSDAVPLAGTLTTAWVYAVEFEGQRTALLEVDTAAHPEASPLSTYLGREPAELAIGTMTDDWLIESISTDAESFLGASGRY